jgi:hypothetical protein
LRPANFPTIRISQLASMLCVPEGKFTKIMEATDINFLKSVFNVSASEYWSTHYVFGKKCRKTTRKSGSQATDILLINAVIPLIFVYGMKRGGIDACEKALGLLEEIACEDNIIIDEWKSSGLDVESAFYSQALIQLRNEYCKKRRCLECRIGSKLISDGKKLKEHEELMLEP